MPEIWEDCYLTFVDSLGDGKMSIGDSIWIYKDWNNDNIVDVTSTDKIWIFDSDLDMVVKELI